MLTFKLSTHKRFRMLYNDVIGSIILCAYAQFYAIAIFVIDRLDTPERGGS